MSGRRTAFVYGSLGSGGGLAIQTANALAGLSLAGPVVALGPPRAGAWPLPGEVPQVTRLGEPPRLAPWRRRLTPLRWATGRAQELTDRGIGRWAASHLEAARPDRVYAFTQVALESLRWCRRHGVPSVLETPNGHLRDFREIYQTESRRWCGRPTRCHPTPAMVARVEEEYALADRIRVSSEWTRESLVERGVPAEKIAVLQQPIDLDRFHPAEDGGGRSDGPLRLCFVGSLDLRKGFPYLLEALRQLEPGTARLEVRGATGDRCCRKLLEQLGAELDLHVEPGNPLTTLHRSDLFVLPTLEDGSPFAAAEAMAAGLPVVIAASCGAAEWVRPGVSGWVVPPRDPAALAGAIREAFERRDELPTMGAAARRDTERRAGPAEHHKLREWLDGDL